jgi:hypothetical protein
VPSEPGARGVRITAAHRDSLYERACSPGAVLPRQPGQLVVADRGGDHRMVAFLLLGDDVCCPVAWSGEYRDELLACAVLFRDALPSVCGGGNHRNFKRPSATKAQASAARRRPPIRADRREPPVMTATGTSSEEPRARGSREPARSLRPDLVPRSSSSRREDSPELGSRGMKARRDRVPARTWPPARMPRSQEIRGPEVGIAVTSVRARGRRSPTSPSPSR